MEGGSFQGVSIDEDRSQGQDPMSTSKDGNVVGGKASQLYKFGSMEDMDQLVASYSEQQAQVLSQIQALRDDVEDSSAMPDWLSELKDEAAEHSITVGTIDANEIELQERMLEEDRVRSTVAAARERKQFEQVQAKRERKARQEIEEQREALLQEARLLEISRVKRERQRLKEVRHAFRAAEERLRHALKRRGIELSQRFGQLAPTGRQGSLETLGRVWRADLVRAPQPLKVRVDTFRCVGDKLPKGKYVILLSIVEYISGRALQWQGLTEHRLKEFTSPVDHEGEYYDLDMIFRDMCHLVIPSEKDIRPTMALQAELFHCGEPADSVVAWGIFPLVDGAFRILKGKFRMPMLAGKVDPRIKTYSAFTKSYEEDLDAWIGNLYFKVAPTSRTVGKRRENVVRLQYTSELLGLQQTRYTRDSTGKLIKRHGRKIASMEAHEGEDLEGDGDEEAGYGSADSLSDVDSEWEFGADGGDITSKDGGVGRNDGVFTRVQLGEHPGLETAARQQAVGRLDRAVGHEADSESQKSGLDLQNQAVKSALVDVDAASDGPSLLHTNSGPRPSSHRDGSERRQVWAEARSGSRLIAGGSSANMFADPDHNVETGPGAEVFVDYDPRLGKYTTSVPQGEPSDRRAAAGRRRRRMVREVLFDLGFIDGRKMKQILVIIAIAMFAWLRIYVHYLAQWVFLFLNNRPVQGLDYLPYRIDINYGLDSSPTVIEIFLCGIGTFANISFFVFIALILWGLQKVFGGAPKVLHTLAICLGSIVWCDPFLILIVDIATGNFDRGDAFKLFHHFTKNENNGGVGAFLTLLVYLALSGLGLMLLYIYIFAVYRNGMILDCYTRIRAKESEMFVPYDIEKSQHDVQRIVRTSHRWRGKGGFFRRTAVVPMQIRHALSSDAVQNALTIARQASSLDGVRAGEHFQTSDQNTESSYTLIAIFCLNSEEQSSILHRAFLRTPTGALMEIIGNEIRYTQPRYVVERITNILDRVQQEFAHGRVSISAALAQKIGAEPRSSSSSMPRLSSSPIGN